MNELDELRFELENLRDRLESMEENHDKAIAALLVKVLLPELPRTAKELYVRLGLLDENLPFLEQVTTLLERKE